MQHYPESIRRLIRNLAKLPGIGEKTAERLAMNILKRPLVEAEQLSESIIEVKQKVQLCTQCYSLSDARLCHICTDTSRDATCLCVVEQPADMISIEKSGAFRGLYHILGGALSPIEGIGPEDIRVKELLSRAAQGSIKEIILATGTNVEGESTASFLAQQLSGVGPKVSRIASGIPVGGDLQYIDQMTLKCAFNGRHDI
jgi:recombination protein RecR